MKRRFVRDGKVIYIEMSDEEFKAHRAEYNRAWRAKNKEKCRQYVVDRSARLKKEAEEMFEIKKLRERYANNAI